MKKLKIDSITLENGLQVVYTKKNASPIMSLNLTYRVGSKNENKKNRGFAHLFEHLMFEGTEKFKKGEFDKICSLAGGTNNAYTIYDWTSYLITLPKDNIETAFNLESDRMYNLSPTLEAFINQKSVVTEEIKQTVFNQPYGRWRELLSETAFPKESGYNWEVHGSIDDIENSTLEDAKLFFDAFYHPKNACLSIVGDYEENYIFDLVEKYFATKKNEESYNTNSFDKVSTGFAEYDDNVPFSAVFFSYHIPNFMSDLSFVGDIVASIAGTGKSSLLYNNLIHKKQIVSEAGAFTDRREHNSLITFYAISNSKDIDTEKLKEILSIEIEKLHNRKTIEEHISRTKNQIKFQHANNLLISANIAEAVGLNQLFFNDPYRLYSALDKYNNVSIEDCLNFTANYITTDNLVQINVNPKS